MTNNDTADQSASTGSSPANDAPREAPKDTTWAKTENVRESERPDAERRDR